MRKNFTLVELLVTVGIIAILAGLVIPAVISSQNQGRITQAKSDMNAIKLALKSVETTYGKIINTGSNQIAGVNYTISNGLLTINDNNKPLYKAFITELIDPQKIQRTSGKNLNFNKRCIKFLDPSADYDPTGDFDGNTADNEWLDPWGKAYNIVIDTSFQGYVTINGKNRAGSFQIYSWGPDGTDNTGDNEDQGGAAGTDDIATWHK